MFSNIQSWISHVDKVPVLSKLGLTKQTVSSNQGWC